MSVLFSSNQSIKPAVKKCPSDGKVSHLSLSFVNMKVILMMMKMRYYIMSDSGCLIDTYLVSFIFRAMERLKYLFITNCVIIRQNKAKGPIKKI